jgi:HK97 gp10 family phage protein
MIVRGVASLRRKLARLPDDVAEGVRREIRTGAIQVLAEMRARAPVSAFPSHPSHVRDQLEARISKNGLRARVGLMGAAFRRTYFYARYLEFGTRKMAKRPFIYNSWASLKGAIRGDVKAAVQKALEQAAAGRSFDG